MGRGVGGAGVDGGRTCGFFGTAPLLAPSGDFVRLPDTCVSSSRVGAGPVGEEEVDLPIAEPSYSGTFQ